MSWKDKGWVNNASFYLCAIPTCCACVSRHIGGMCVSILTGSCCACVYRHIGVVCVCMYAFLLDPVVLVYVGT